MLSKLRNRQKGFTLIELLIVVAIIGIIAALLIPNFLDALNKARQKRTMGDMTNVGKAAFAWLTDELGAAAAGATTLTWSDYDDATIDQVRSELVSQYIQEIPLNDGWKNSYAYKMDLDSPEDDAFFAIWSGGRDGNGASPAATYTIGGFDPTDYDQDIVWADGSFARRPEKQ